MAAVYTINKGINKPIEFQGLKAQYIIYLALGLIALLVLFAVLYITGVNMFLSLFFIGALGTLLFVTVHRLSDTYGQFGLLKKWASLKLPSFIKCSSRRVFHNLLNPAP